jgi:manganese/zinc/iron transport system permease protein
MSALVVAPAAAARQWTDRLGPMVGLAAAFGALAGVLGAFASGATTHVPTGPAIVVVISVLVLVSLLFAPNRGVLWEAARRALTRRRLSAERVLCDVYELALQHDDTTHPHETGTLKVMTAPSRGVRRCLVELARRGLVQTLSGDRWALTAEGEARAVDVLRARGVLP